MVAVSFELAKVLPCFIKFVEFLDNVCDCYVVKKTVIHGVALAARDLNIKLATS